MGGVALVVLSVFTFGNDLIYEFLNNIRELVILLCVLTIYKSLVRIRERILDV